MKKLEPNIPDRNAIIPHNLNPRWLSHPIYVAVIGAGGNGSQIVNGLARMHLSIKALGHPFGLRVTLFDPDKVSEANIGRQLFSAGDVGQFKAHVLINRLNGYYGLNWAAHAEFFNPEMCRHFFTGQPSADSWGGRSDPDLVIGCVDTRQSRRWIHGYITNHTMNHIYWLDCGNEARTAQIVLGENTHVKDHAAAIKAAQKGGHKEIPEFMGPKLPTVTELFRELMDEDVKEDNTPSCSLAGALEKQDLFINPITSNLALNLLWRLMRTGKIDHHGYFANLEYGTVSPLTCSYATWERFGYYHHQAPPWRKIKKVIKEAGIMRKGKFILECGHRAEGHGKTKARCFDCQREGKKA